MTWFTLIERKEKRKTKEVADEKGDEKSIGLILR
jgi:hypothetical protein